MLTEHIENRRISREAIIEYLKNPDNVQLQYRYRDTQYTCDTWFDLDSIYCRDIFNLNIFYYRIKPISKWYRVALLKNNGILFTATVDDDISESNKFPGVIFIKWLTDRIEYNED